MSEHAELAEEVMSLLLGNPLDDPYELYARLRAEAPILRVRNFVIVTRYEDVREVYSDSNRFMSNHYRPGTAEYEQIRDAVEALDEDDRRRYDEVAGFQQGLVAQSIEPEHGRRREVFHRAFNPRHLAALEEQIEDVVAGLLDGLGRHPTPDALGEFARRVPQQTHMRILGVPERDLELITSWAKRFISFTGRRDMSALRPWHRMLSEFRQYFQREIVDAQTRKPGELTFMPVLIEARDAGEIDDDELVGMCATLLLTGTDTTMSLIATGLVSLMRHRDQWERLCAEPELFPHAIEECLRFEPPVQGSGRNVMKATGLGGETIPAGCRVLAMIGSANHDPAVFAEPDSFLIDRTDGARKLTFAGGDHQCLGSLLARLEGRVALSGLARRYPGIRLAQEEVVWFRSPMIRTPDVLPVTLGAQATVPA